jgi:putative ABC transport system ATP-binding protein
MAANTENISPLSRLLKLLQLEKKDILVIIMLTFGAGFLALATPIAVQTLVNIVAMGNVVQPLIVVSFMLFLLLLLAGALSILEYYVVELIQRRIFVRNALQSAAQAQAMHVTVRDTQNPVELMNRFFDVSTVQKTSYQLLTKGLAAALQAIVGSFVLMFYSVYFGLGVAILFLITWFIVSVIGRVAIHTAIQESYAKYEVAAWLETIGRNLNMFKFGSSQAYAMHRVDELAGDYLERRKKHFATLLKQNALATFIYALAGTLMLGLGGWLVMEGQINLGQFVAAELIIFGVLAAFLSFISKLEYFYDLLAGLDKLGMIQDLPSERQGGHSLQVAQAYRVEASKVVLPNRLRQNEINLEVASGNSLAILADDDGAKTILAELLVGLRNPLAGVVKVNDSDIRQLDLSGMRHHVAFVGHVEILEESILSNLTLQHAETSLEEVNFMLDTLGLRDAIAALPEGLDTVLLPSGASITNTQARMLMIARALLMEPRLIVVDSLLDALHGDALNNACRALQSRPDGWSLIVVTSIRAIASRFDQIYELGST